jgi:hypothetical protein
VWPIEGLSFLGPFDVPFMGDELRDDLGWGDGRLRPRALQAVVLSPHSFPLLLEEELRLGSVLCGQGEPDALAVGTKADVRIKEKVAGLFIFDGAFAAARTHNSVIIFLGADKRLPRL